MKTTSFFPQSLQLIWLFCLTTKAKWSFLFIPKWSCTSPKLCWVRNLGYLTNYEHTSQKYVFGLCVLYFPLKEMAFDVYDRVTGLGTLTLEEMMWGYNTPPQKKTLDSHLKLWEFMHPMSSELHLRWLLVHILHIINRSSMRVRVIITRHNFLFMEAWYCP